MNILTTILLIISIIFIIYKAYLKLAHKMEERKNVNSVKWTKNKIDERFYSYPSFDFPNTQSEFETKVINSGPDLCEEQNEIHVEQYCKY